MHCWKHSTARRVFLLGTGTRLSQAISRLSARCRGCPGTLVSQGDREILLGHIWCCVFIIAVIATETLRPTPPSPHTQTALAGCDPVGTDQLGMLIVCCSRASLPPGVPISAAASWEEGGGACFLLNQIFHQGTGRKSLCKHSSVAAWQRGDRCFHKTGERGAA